MGFGGFTSAWSLFACSVAADNASALSPAVFAEFTPTGRRHRRLQQGQRLGVVRRWPRPKSSVLSCVQAGEADQVANEPAARWDSRPSCSSQPLALLGIGTLVWCSTASAATAVPATGVPRSCAAFGHEPAGAFFGGPRGRLGAFQSIEHRVECGRGAPQLRVSAGGRQPAAASGAICLASAVIASSGARSGAPPQIPLQRLLVRFAQHRVSRAG
jgi:hypothetical protein